MINLKGKDSVADAVKSVLSREETDVDSRTKDDIGGRKKSTQKDDVGPASDGKSTKVKLHGESVVKKLADTKPETLVKTDEPEPREKIDAQAEKQNKTLRNFKEKYEGHSIYDQLINEVLSTDASAGAWIKDFVNSDNPKFAGKSKEQRKKQALAAYYAKQRNEEVEQVEEGLGDTIKKGLKKAAEVLGGPDDEGHKKDLQRKMGATPEQQHGKKSMAKYNEETQTVEEGWDDMLKDVKSKKGPQPSGGSGVKQGSRYGGGKQKDKPEQEEDKKVNEAKRPETDDVPFAPPYNTTSSPEVKDKSGATHTPMSRAKHLARFAMSKVKKDLGQKKAK